MTTEFSTTLYYLQDFALSCMKNVGDQSRSITRKNKKKTQDRERCVRFDLSWGYSVYNAVERQCWFEK